MKKTIRKKSQEQEKFVARELGGRVTIASGALVQKGDVITSDFVLECKTTSKKSYLLKESIWKKICKEATKRNGLKTPAMVINLRDEEKDSKSYVVISRLTFDWLREESKKAGRVFNIISANSDELNTSYSVRDLMEVYCHSTANINPRKVYLVAFFQFTNAECLVQMKWSLFTDMLYPIVKKGEDVAWHGGRNG